ncbi:MAG TPA: V-type ATP synthase subunit F [Gemmatimonadales bacterium]|nr:V-type ATP synthase subunit F [Gemmatimonadales bacterium]
MALELRVLCRPEVGTGFSLAGLAPTEASSNESGAAALRELMSDKETGVVLVQDAMYDALPDDVRRQLGRRPLPLVVPFPGPVWTKRPEAAESYIIELLRQVIGYRVRLK